MNDIHTKFVLETIHTNMMEFICNSEGHIDSFWKSLNREELSIYSNESKRIGDIDTYNKLQGFLNEP